MSSDGGTSWKAVSAIVNVNTATATVGSLTGGIGYNFRVAAETTVGPGVFSARSNFVVPTQAADPPSLTSLTSNGNSITLSWIDPLQGYGAAVADYQVEWVELDENNNPLDETKRMSFTANRREFTASGLSASTKYDFRVRAKLVTGTYSAWSESTDL